MDNMHRDTTTLTDELQESLDKLVGLTPEQLKIVAEFVTQAGGFDKARAAIEAIQELCDAA
jgi:hypothetical protein